MNTFIAEPSVFLERPRVDACRPLFEAQPSAFNFRTAFNTGKSMDLPVSKPKVETV